MLVVVGFSMLILMVFVLAGYPITKYVISSRAGFSFTQFPVVMTLCLIFGFFLSSLSSTIAYGLVGIDSYPVVLLILICFSWLLLGFLRLKKKIEFKKIQFKKSHMSILYILSWSLILCRFQWESITKPKLVSGDGPDTSQNLMTAMSARSLGDTWSQQAEKITSFFGNDSLRQTVFDLYRYPSFRDQAGFDYLVFGTRWGLSVPYSQLLRVFGEKFVLAETGVVITTSLLVLGVMVYGITSLLVKNRYAPLAASIISISNSLLLVQYFNGGLSQVWSISGILGISLILILIVKSDHIDFKLPSSSLVLIAMASWTILITTYVDAAVILGLLTLISILIYFAVDKTIAFKLARTLFGAGFLSLLLNPILTYATLLTFDLRLRAATGTGSPTRLWTFPSEILGFIDVFSNSTGSRSFETAVVGLLSTLFIFASLFRNSKIDSEKAGLSYLSLAVIITILVGFFLSFTGKMQTTYIYNKIGVYLAPLLLILWVSSITGYGEKSEKLAVAKNTKSAINGKSKIGYLGFLSFVVVVAMLSSLSATRNLSKQGTTIPYEFSTMIENRELQERILKFNYITPYILSANFLGVLADIHWISKAPNDIKLDSRLNNELRLICFSGDLNCKPSSKRIVDLELESYGLFQYESPITSREFAKLSPLDRYRVSFEFFGIPPQEIPERFIGGNPYYN